MNPIHRIRWMAGALGGLACTLLACAATAPAALAEIPASPGEMGHPVKHALSVPVRVQTVVSGGMPGWQITLIAAGAALIAATAAVLLDRARTARRYAITTSA
jgi:hypothetical protein